MTELAIPAIEFAPDELALMGEFFKAQADRVMREKLYNTQKLFAKDPDFDFVDKFNWYKDQKNLDPKIYSKIEPLKQYCQDNFKNEFLAYRFLCFVAWDMLRKKMSILTIDYLEEYRIANNL